MSGPERARELVVGFDGSELSRRALRMACAVAGDGARITVVHAYEIPTEIAYYPFFQDFEGACRKVAEDVLEPAREIAARCDAEVTFEAAPGKPAAVLSDLARLRGADLIVVGSRGVGPLRGLGSVTHRLLSRAPCPVLVVPDPGDAEELRQPPEPRAGAASA
jgi:nucleotide-binding universal stress UspA family protein